MKKINNLKLGENKKEFYIGCHVSAAGGVFNAPKNASLLECETFQIFTRPPMGGTAPVIDDLMIERFRILINDSMYLLIFESFLFFN